MPKSNSRCCAWKRSKNDSLLDPATGTKYCGTCWQQWYISKTKYPSKPDREETSVSNERSTSPEAERKTVAIVEQEDTIRGLEIFEDKDKKVFLISRERNLVFNTERTKDGKLECVGELFGHGESISIKLYNVKSVAQVSEFPFSTSPEDHCETPFSAYEDLARYLQYFGKQIGKNRRSLKIWDPYFCNGAVKENLARLGFLSVYNECEDFYELIRMGKLPDYDCIVTNPPYSTEPMDHIHELFKFLCTQTKPWFVLQPNYVYTKQFWDDLTSAVLPAPRPFFLTPESPRKYKYQTPSGIRRVTSSKKLRTSPFVSMWYCWLGDQYVARMFKWIASMHSRTPLPLTLACCEFFIPDSFKDSSDRTRRKKRKRSDVAGHESRSDKNSSNPAKFGHLKRTKRALP